MPDLKEDEFRGRVIFALLAVTGIGLALVFAWIGRVILMLVFASAIGAILLTTVADWLHKKFRIKQGLALVLFMLALVGAIALLVFVQGDNVARQFAMLEVELPSAARKLLAQVQSHQWGQWLLHMTPGSDQLSNGFNFAISQIGGIVVSSVTLLAGLVIVLSLSLYLSSEPGLYYNGIRRVVPEKHREKLDACAASVVQILKWWVLAKLISMTMVGILVTVGLSIVGVPLAGTLGIIAALMTFIPNVGPIISVVPAALLALAASGTQGLLTLLVYAIVFTLEGYVVTPMLERNIVKLPPALTLAMQLLLAAIAGPIGVALAAPIAAAILGTMSVLLPQTEDVTLPEPPKPQPRPRRRLRAVKTA
jgi:predicted PurR-regulated permease PerM